MRRGLERFVEQARLGGGIVPVTREVVLDGDTPVTAFGKQTHDLEDVFLRVVEEADNAA